MSLRIVSLVPSVTELLVDLGAGPWLVGRTGYCIHPKAALAAVPKVGGTKTVNLDKLRRLAPTHVIVNVDENTLETVQALREFVPQVVVTHPCAPHDNLALYRQMAECLPEVPGIAERAARWCAALERELQLTADTEWPQRQVLYCIWREPWMTVARDTYLSRMLALVNWQTLPDVAGGERGAARYPAFDWAADWVGRLDRVLLSSEPYSFGPSHAAEVRATLAACRPGAEVQVHCVDGEMLSWYGSRAVQGVAYLRGLAQQGQ